MSIELEKILGQLTEIIYSENYEELKEVHKRLSNYIYNNSPEEIKQYSWTADKWSK